MGRFLVLALAGLMVSGSAGAEGKKTKPESLAKLELSVEIATTDDDGYPSALRITIRNVGGVPVDMPVLHERCSRITAAFISSRAGRRTIQVRESAADTDAEAVACRV